MEVEDIKKQLVGRRISWCTPCNSEPSHKEGSYIVSDVCQDSLFDNCVNIYDSKGHSHCMNLNLVEVLLTTGKAQSCGMDEDSLRPPHGDVLTVAATIAHYSTFFTLKDQGQVK